MTEEECPNNKSVMSISVESLGTEITASGSNWPEVLASLAIGIMKHRICGLSDHSLTWVPDSGWILSIPEPVGQVRERIVLALLLHSPSKLTRMQLSCSSTVEVGSLRSYLTKHELGVVPLIVEDDEGIALNDTGYMTATGILESLLVTKIPGGSK